MVFVSLQTIGWTGLAVILYNVSLVIYRLYFHPLARFPGPKIAAATAWWECIQDLFGGRQGGDYINQVEQMHNDYGPVVRVTPDEIHVKDSEWSHVLYAGPGHVRDKDSSLAHAAGTAHGTFGSVSHSVHRRRRIPVSSYFSTTSVHELQRKVWEGAGHLCDVLRGHHEADRVVNGRATFLGWANDTLRSCAFGKSLDLLDHSDRAVQFDNVFKAFGAFYPILKQCEWMIPAALQLPITPLRYICSPLAALLTVRKEMIDLAQKARAEHREMRIAENTGSSKTNKEQYFHNLYHALLASNLPEDEKRPERIAHEGFEILLAGSDTTARTMGVAVYHLIANPHIAQRLREELKTVMPRPQDTVELKTLNALPWLGSVIKESLRTGKVTDHRLSLIATEEVLRYQDWLIPAGTRVSMTLDRNSYDTKFFPEPRKFAPERWLQDEETVAAMDHVFMPFAAGTRGCLGMHFAKAELHIGLARMFRQFDFELYDTVRERDIDHTWAHIAGEPDKGGKGLRFKVKEVFEG